MMKSSCLGNGGGEAFRTLQVLKIEEFQFQYLPRDWMTLWETLWSRLQVLLLIGPWWGSYQIFQEDEETMGGYFEDYMERDDPRFRELFDQDRMEELAKRLGPPRTMRDLTLVDNNECPNEALFEIQRWMVLQCPKVVRLEWRVDWPKKEESSPMLQMRNIILNAQLSKLDAPPFQDLQTVALSQPFDETDFILLVQAMPYLTELNMRRSEDFVESSWKALMAATPRHLETLRVVNVRGLIWRPWRCRTCSVVCLIMKSSREILFLTRMCTMILGPGPAREHSSICSWSLVSAL